MTTNRRPIAAAVHEIENTFEPLREVAKKAPRKLREKSVFRYDIEEAYRDFCMWRSNTGVHDYSEHALDARVPEEVRNELLALLSFTSEALLRCINIMAKGGKDDMAIKSLVRWWRPELEFKGGCCKITRDYHVRDNFSIHMELFVFRTEDIKDNPSSAGFGKSSTGLLC